MNKQRKVVITTTYNEMGIIIDKKVEEVAQPNLQPSSNHLATDTISRQAAIDALEDAEDAFGYLTKDWREVLEQLPPIQPEIIRCKDCKHFAGEGMYCSCDIIVQFNHFYCYHAERRQDV